MLLDQQHPEIAPLGQCGDGLFDLVHHRGLDAFGGLVEDQAFRCRDERAGDRELLTLAAGEQPGATSQQFLECREQVQLFVDECLAVFTAVGDHLEILGGGELAEGLLTLGHIGDTTRDAGARA